MVTAFDLTQAILDEAKRRGIPMTVEQAAAKAASQTLGVTHSPQSRTDGAPSDDLSGNSPVTGLTPPSYLSDLEAGAGMAEQADGEVWLQPGTDAFENEGDLLSYRPGMDEAEYRAAKADGAHRRGLLRGMGPDLGGYTAFNPQQPMYLGDADQQEKWQQFLEDNPKAQERYDPAAYAARKAAEEKAAAQEHAAMLRAKYGDPVADAYMESQASGTPMPMDLVRTPDELAAIYDRRNNERSAREGGPRGQEARAALEEQDERSGYSGAMGGARVSGKWAVGDGPDGQPEAKYQRFARKTQERKEELDARKLALRNQRMLAGSNPANNMANAYTLMGDPFNDGLTENQRRALEYMLPSGQLAAEVDARNMEEAAGLAARGLQSVLLPTVMQGMNGGNTPNQQGRMDVVNGANGGWQSVEGRQYMYDLGSSFDTKDEFVQYLIDQMDYGQPEAEAAAAYVSSKIWNW